MFCGNNGNSGCTWIIIALVILYVCGGNIGGLVGNKCGCGCNSCGCGGNCGCNSCGCNNDCGCGCGCGD
jgi:hypothetical protein